MMVIYIRREEERVGSNSVDGKQEKKKKPCRSRRSTAGTLSQIGPASAGSCSLHFQASSPPTSPDSVPFFYFSSSYSFLFNDSLQWEWTLAYYQQTPRRLWSAVNPESLPQSQISDPLRIPPPESICQWTLSRLRTANRSSRPATTVGGARSSARGSFHAISVSGFCSPAPTVMFCAGKAPNSARSIL